VICLTENDLRKLADSLGELYQACALDAFGERALAVLPALVGCDTCSYNEVNPGRRRVVARTAPDGYALPGMVEAYQEHMGQHPLIGHYRATRDGRALKIADFLSLREFRQLPLYRDFYRLAGVSRQLAVTVPGRPGVIIGLAVSRAGRDFSERDRAALDFLRLHLIRAYASAAALTAAGLDVRTLSETAAGGCDGTAVIAADGRLSYLSDRARDLLSRYLGPAEPGGLLPGPLRLWRAAALARSDPAGPAPAVLGLGLTQREAEVIRLAAEGRTNREIADLLGISPLTVRKHLEHAYPKLGVGNRTAAAARLR
jgi:DNA-binding CsgD family transcriptional regulator